MPLEAEDARKLDALGTQLSAVLVQQATLGQQMSEIGRDIARQGLDHADHEGRLRILEAIGCKQHSEDLVKHAGRLDKLEQWRWKTAGVVAACTFLGGAGGAGLTLIGTALLHTRT